MASNLLVIASNLLAMASNLLAMPQVMRIKPVRSFAVDTVDDDCLSKNAWTVLGDHVISRTEPNGHGGTSK